MTDKITFRAVEHGRRFVKRGGWGIDHPEDADLDHDEAGFIGIWRARYRRFLDRAHNPRNRDIKATLQALARASEGDLPEAVRCLDPATDAHLKRAAHREFRRLHPAGPIPPDAIRIRALGANGKVHPHPRIRKLAALALAGFPKARANENSISGLDRLFAVALVTRWNLAHPGSPARIADRHAKRGPGLPSDFEVAAWDWFARVGRRSNRRGAPCLDEASLVRALSRAIAEVKRRAVAR